MGRGAAHPWRDAWLPGGGGSGQLSPADRRLEDQRNLERLRRRRLVHPDRNREEPGSPGVRSPSAGANDVSRNERDDVAEEICGAVVVMAKAPREGFVKTRLIGAYPAGDIVQLADCMLRDTVDLVQQLPGVHVAVMCPADDVSLVVARVPAGVQVVGQRGRGLAEGLTSVF